MKLVKASFEILAIMGLYDGEDDEGCFMYRNNSLLLIEEAGRTCYKSEDNIAPGSAEKFVQKLINLGHESVLEHSAMTVKFICDRGVSHELVRHRLASFSQESTRYCNYKGGVSFIIPSWVDIEEGEYPSKDSYPTSELTSQEWYDTMIYLDKSYNFLIRKGWSPQQARSVLPNSLKTELVMTTNFREWRHIFKLRCSKSTHPQMRELMIPLLSKCKELIPVVFDDITY